MWKKIEKGIVQEGKHSYRVRMMIGDRKINKTFDTLIEARAFRNTQKAEAEINPHAAAIHLARAIKIRDLKGYTLADAIRQYRTEKSEKKKGWQSEGSRLDRIERLSIAKMHIYAIKKDALLNFFNEIRSGQGQQIKGVKQRPCSDATVKRYYNLLRHVFEVAKGWGKIEQNPFDLLSKEDRPKGGNERNRRLEGDEYEQLQKHLKGEALVALIMLVESAMRRGDLLSLEWQNIRIKQGTAFLPDGKTGEPRTVPLSDAAIDALLMLTRGIRGKVFTITPDALRYQWRKARVAIGAPDLRLHDLRHEAASRLAGAQGLSIFELQAVTGHKTITMLKRYINLKPDEIRAKMNKRS